MRVVPRRNTCHKNGTVGHPGAPLVDVVLVHRAYSTKRGQKPRGDKFVRTIPCAGAAVQQAQLRLLKWRMTSGGNHR